MIWILTCAVAAYELALALGPRRENRRRIFQKAVLRAQVKGKPLLVIGGPRAGFINQVIGQDYGCGTVCIDLEGCIGCKNGIETRAEDFLVNLPDDSFVVYVSCTLEYVDDIELVSGELFRVSGDDLFVVPVEPKSLTAFFYPGAKRRVIRAPEGNGVPIVTR